jgi:hypothetical protein
VSDHLLEFLPALFLLGELLAGILGDELGVGEASLQDQVLVSRLKDLSLQLVLLLSDLGQKVPQLLVSLQACRLSYHCRVLHRLQIVPLHLLELGSDLSEFDTNHVFLAYNEILSPLGHLLLSLVQPHMCLLHLHLS